MSAHYVIKGYHWGYNDETFYPEGGFIHNVYTDKDKANSDLVKLERKHWRRMDLSETHVLFDGDKSVLEQLNKLLMDSLGETLDESGRDVYVPAKLNDEDFMRFLDIADIRSYKLIESDDEPEFWVIWVNEEEEYLYAGEDESLVFGSSLDDLKSELNADPWTLTYLFDDSGSLEGELNEISKSPKLMEQLIQSHKGLSYEDGSLFIDEDDIDAHFAANELLNEPIFEAKKVSIDKLRQLQGSSGTIDNDDLEYDEISRKAEQLVGEEITDVLLNALGGMFGSKKSDSVVADGAIEASVITEELIHRLFSDLSKQENSHNIDGVLSHYSRKVKVTTTFYENGEKQTMPMSYTLYKMALKMTLTPEAEYASEEKIEKIEIQDGVAKVLTYAQIQCIDLLKKELTQTNAVNNYTVEIVENKLVVTEVTAEEVR